MRGGMFDFFYLRRDPNEFVADRYGPAERRQRELAKRGKWWRRHLAWIASQPWPLQVIIILFWITGASFALLFGAFLGLVIRFAIGY